MIAASCGSVRTFQMEASRCNDTILLCQTQSSQVSLSQTCLQLASPSCQEAEVHLPHQRLALHPSKTPMPGAFYSFIRSPHLQRCRNFPESPLRLSRLYRGQRCLDRLQLADLLPQQQRCIRSQETSRVKLGRNSSTSSSPAAALFLPFNVLVAIRAVSVSVRRIPALLPVTWGKLSQPSMRSQRIVRFPSRRRPAYHPAGKLFQHFFGRRSRSYRTVRHELSLTGGR